MSFNHLKVCTHCGIKIRPNDAQYTCDICGQVYCPKCKERYLAIAQGKQRFTQLVCPNCLNLNGMKILNNNINN